MHKKERERGSVMVIMALSLVMLLAFSALVVDLGMAYSRHVKVSAAVDAAALAGAQELIDNPSNAYNMSLAYAERNGLLAEEVIIDILPGDKGVEVKATQQVDLFFAPVINIDYLNVSAVAIAEVGNYGGGIGMVPLGVLEENFTAGKEYVLKVGALGTEEGWFGPLALGGTGAATYEENLTEGYAGPDPFRVGDIVDLELGNISNPTARAIEERIDACDHVPPCTHENYDEGCSRIVIVPIISMKEDDTELGNNQARIEAFAPFIIEDYVPGQGNQSEIFGYFLEEYTFPGFADNEVTYTGLYGLSLTK